MGRPKARYTITAEYPESEAGMRELRLRMGTAYVDFARKYISDMQLTNKKKKELYYKTLNILRKS